MLDIEVRRANVDDAGVVAEVWLRSRHAALGHIPRAVHSDADVREWISTRVLAENECWVAHTHEGQIVAVLVLDGSWIDQLYVLPEFQRSGVGSTLIDLAKRRSPELLQLWTFETNAPAQLFYERHGFSAVERTDGKRNEEQAPDVRYVFSRRVT